MAISSTSGLPAVVSILQLGSGVLSSAAIVPASMTVGNVATTLGFPVSAIMTTGFGALPVGGATGQILNKTDGGNFDTQWSSVTQFVTAGGGLASAGSTSVALSLASAAGLSVMGVAASATAVPAPIVASSSAQILQSNAGGTGLFFGALNSSLLPGPFQATSFIQFGSIYGNNTSALGVTSAGTTGWPLLGNGGGSPPAFAQLNLAIGATGVLPVSSGGQGTSTLTAHGVVIGKGTAAVGITAAGTASFVLMGNGTTVDPSFQQFAVANLSAIAGSTLIANNTNATAAPSAVAFGSVVGHTLLNAIATSGATSIQDTTSFTSTFDNYMIVSENVIPTNSATQFQMLLQAGGVFQSASYLNVTGSATTFIDFVAAALIGTTATSGFSSTNWLYNVNSTTGNKVFRGTGAGLTNTGTFANVVPVSIYTASGSTVTGFKLQVNTGTFSGTVRVYGLRNS